jgi:hypothetical protein
MPVSDVTWDQLEDFVREDGWTVERFAATYRLLLKSKTWIAPGDTMPRFAIGDWFRFDAQTERVHGRRWYIAKIQDDARNRDRIGIYNSPRGIVYGWRADVREYLAEWVPTPQTGIQPLLETPMEKLPQELRDAIELSKDLILAQERIDDLLAEIRRANSENNMLRRQVMALEREMEEMRGRYESTIRRLKTALNNNNPNQGKRNG